MEQNVVEAVEYFKTEKFYQKLFLAFRKKYESLGRIGGSVSLDVFSIEEIERLSRFLGIREDHLLEKKTVTLKQFEKQLQSYRFGDLSLKELLEAYFKEPLISNKERKEKRRLRKENFLGDLKNKYTYVNEWLSYIELNHADSYWIHQLITSSHEKFEQCVAILNQVVKNLPGNPIRLPVFAQQMTKNPHSFDQNQDLGKLLLHLFTVTKALSMNESVKIPNTSEEKTELLFEFNVLRDDITNYVSVANILAETSDNKNQVWEVASKTNTVLNVPLRELIQVESLYPTGSGDDVWLVENSGVFSAILDQVPNVPLICTHGQFTLAVWRCLDLLVRRNCTLYYSGDFDAEGIGMANRLLERYPEQIKLWKMDTMSYEKSVFTEEKLSEKRLNQLSGINTEELEEIKNKILHLKFPGYQEALLDEMIEELMEKY